MANEVMNQNVTEAEEMEIVPTNHTGRYVICGLGNCGHAVVDELSTRQSLNDVDLFAIDSIAANVTMASINSRVEYIPIISDEKSGSGRNRERGGAMFDYHYALGTFNKMLDKCMEAKTPVIIITSAAGGTGSGSAPRLCKILLDMDIMVIPIIICPSMDDPTAYHLNTNDLLMELDEAGVQTYAVFRNVSGDSNYTPVNNEVAEMIEIILGKKYGPTNLDSIDDSDLDSILNMPGRFVAISAQAKDLQTLTRQITRKMFTGFQPSWTDEDAKKFTFMTGYSLKSMFAGEDFKQVFDEVRNRIYSVYDEYRHIEQVDNGGEVEATVIIAGLPRPEIKMIETEYNAAGSIGAGMKRSARPKFMNKKKASISQKTGTDGNAIGTFKWKK